MIARATHGGWSERPKRPKCERKALVHMETETELEERLPSRKRLLAATIGSGALALLALFGVAHTLPTALATSKAVPAIKAG